jgi:hypothetical protein
LTSGLGLAVTLLWLRAPVWNIIFSGWVFLVPHRERTGLFSNYPFGLLQSLLGLLHKSYSDSAPFQEALGVLKVSHKERPHKDLRSPNFWRRARLRQQRTREAWDSRRTNPGNCWYTWKMGAKKRSLPLTYAL